MNRFVRFITMLMLAGSCMAGLAQNIYVDAAREDDSGAGYSWATAKKTLAAGIAAAGANGTVFVKAGQYDINAELTIPAGKIVMGGYAPSSTGTDTSKRNLPGANFHWTDANWCTIITGAGNHRIATVNGQFDGCVLRHGFTNVHGGGVLIDGNNAVVRYCVIKECDAITEDDTPAEGGGAYVQNGGTLLNCVVTDCRGDKGSGVAGGNGFLISNTITRNRPTDCGVVADYDGNLYQTVVIGEQCWMRENLRTRHFSDGTAIEEITSGNTTSTTTPYFYRNYQTSEDYAIVYTWSGYLYNWPAVMHGAASSNANPSGVQGICPVGWHVPSISEWNQMINYVRSDSRYWCNNDSRYYIKSLAAKTEWNVYNNTCYIGGEMSSNNATLFSAYPAGHFEGSYSQMKNYADIWSSTETGNNAYYKYIGYSMREGVGEGNFYKGYGLSVRCVKDI